MNSIGRFLVVVGVLGFVSSQLFGQIWWQHFYCTNQGRSCVACVPYTTCTPTAGGGAVGAGGASGCLQARPANDCAFTVNPLYFCSDNATACDPRMPMCVFTTGFGWVPTPCWPGGGADCSDCSGM